MNYMKSLIGDWLNWLIVLWIKCLENTKTEIGTTDGKTCLAECFIKSFFFDEINVFTLKI